MKRPLIGASIAILLFAIGCSQNSDNQSANSTPATTTSGTAAPPATATDASPSAAVSTSTTPAKGYPGVQALLNTNCLPCHSEKAHKAGLSVATYEGVMKKVTAGDPDKSELVQAIEGSHGKKLMPMNKPKLSDADIAAIRDWVKSGAKNS